MSFGWWIAEDFLQRADLVLPSFRRKTTRKQTAHTNFIAGIIISSVMSSAPKPRVAAGTSVTGSVSSAEGISR
ncbi:MAG: hypothetical protein DI595_17225 [Agrobacterium fabrum]|uniref:Uncharacterized protein n=1 Tax=Agrobacterium fabrum TaxID=1176649 RepID=A0A2W5GUI9_9HYPH|nr:MAG: hypothetical protein DI595_17225 [Agrobacterium fabrum]